MKITEEIKPLLNAAIKSNGETSERKMSQALETLKKIKNDVDEVNVRHTDVIHNENGEWLVSGSLDGHDSWIFKDRSILAMNEFTGEFTVL